MANRNESRSRHGRPSSNRSGRRISRRRVFQRMAAGGMLASGLTVRSSKVSGASPAKILARRKSSDSVFKSTARTDYALNMREFGGQLASPATALLNRQRPHCLTEFDVLIVGSGYGASISAARLAAQLNGRLGVLERGKEWVPGSFPDSLSDVTDQSRLKLLGRSKGSIANPIGLYNVQQFD